MAILALRKADSERCAKVLAGLNYSSGEEAAQWRRVMDYIERKVAEVDQGHQGRRRNRQ